VTIFALHYPEGNTEGSALIGTQGSIRDKRNDLNVTNGREEARVGDSRWAWVSKMGELVERARESNIWWK